MTLAEAFLFGWAFVATLLAGVFAHRADKYFRMLYYLLDNPERYEGARQAHKEFVQEVARRTKL